MTFTLKRVLAATATFAVVLGTVGPARWNQALCAIVGALAVSAAVLIVRLSDVRRVLYSSIGSAGGAAAGFGLVPYLVEQNVLVYALSSGV